MAFADFDDSAFVSGVCDYLNLSDVTKAFCNSFMHLNVRSQYHKVSELEALLNILGFPKVLLITETWLSPTSPLQNIANYHFVSSPRISGRGGGVGMYIHNSLQYNITYKSSNHPGQFKNIDYLLIELLHSNISLACIYNPDKNLSNLISSIEHIKSLLHPAARLIIGGDFNIDLIDNNSALATDFLDSLHALSLHPIITLPTRVTASSATLLDNFLCDISCLPVCSTVIKTDISDHYLIELSLNSTINNDISITKRNFSNNNKTKFSYKLRVADWSPLYALNDVNKAFNYFIRKLKRIYNKCFPFEKSTSSFIKTPWLTKGLLKSVRHKNRLFLQAKFNPNLKQEYKTYRNKLTNLIRISKLNYHKQILLQLKSNSRKMWSYLNNLISSNNSNNIPVSANTLNDFFTSVFKQAPNYQPDQNHTLPDSYFVAKCLFLSPITFNETISTIASLSNTRAIGSDGLSPELIKSNAALISHQLTYIFNLSLTQGIFPNLLKNAIVVPIFKGGSHVDPSNYRPISILTTFSKILEKLFHNRLLGFINRNNTLHNNQFGFRGNKSTSHAIANVLSSVINKSNSNKKVAFVLLDLKKAFDFINHDLLTVKLKHYGIRGLPLSWITSYLSNRSQKTKVNGSFSTSQSILAGVPQGSIISPLLFNLFINDVFQFNSTNCEIYLYADDTAVVLSANSESELQNNVNNFFARYCAWCQQNCIVVNPAKSCFLCFNNTNNIIVSINGHAIENTCHAKYLGLIIDNHLLWNHHVAHVTKLCCQRIGIFKKVLPALPKYVLPLYYNAFIKSCFSYCLMFWINNNRSGRHKLINKIDNLILKLNSIINLHAITDSCLYNVWAVYKLQCLSFMYNICNNHITLAFLPMATNSMVHCHFTRTHTNLHINSISSLDRRNFIYNAMLCWNQCPIEIRLLPKSTFLHECKKLL